MVVKHGGASCIINLYLYRYGNLAIIPLYSQYSAALFLPADSYLDATGISPIFPASSALVSGSRWPGASLVKSKPNVAITPLPFL